jgi:ATP-dependent helicase IRC3
MENFKLRPYQEEAIEAVKAARRRGIKRLLVCLPTGAGKTVVFARLAALAKRQVIVLAHREELLTQARDKLQKTLGEGVVVGIEQGSMRAPKDAHVIVCSIRSLHEERLGKVMMGRDIGLIIYDECHHAPAEDNMRVLRQIGCFEPDWPGTLLGFTATTTRGDGIGLEKVFEEIVYSKTLPEMIEDNYLVKLRGLRVATGTNLSHLKERQDADLEVEPLAEAVDIEERNALVARSIQDLARDRRTIVFCVTVQHATHLARALTRLGHPAAVIHGEMHPLKRQEVLAMFRAGTIKALTNVAVLTEGFDDPEVSCVAMARPTRSPGLYAQCVGRGTRPFPGKEDCLVLDFVDLSELSLMTLPSLFGMPRDVQLDGEDVVEAGKTWRQLWFDYQGFELEAGEVTLREIQQRAQGFDPLTMKLDPEIAAVSPNAWISLGKKGLALHFYMKGERREEVLVLVKAANGRVRYEVQMFGRAQGEFATMAQAVEAVDFEIEQSGARARATALPDAPWRREPAPPEMLQALLALRPPRRAANLDAALHYLTFAQHQPAAPPTSQPSVARPSRVGEVVDTEFF